MRFRPNGRPRRTDSRSRGQALVEFALVFPVFIFLVFALIDLARLVYIDNAISQAAREGARWGAVQGRAFNSGGRAAISTYTAGVMSAVPDPTVTVTCQDGLGNARPSCTTNNILIVQVSTPVSMFTPILAQLVGTQTYTATAKVEVSY